MSDERVMILRMLKEGKLTVEEAEALLEALDEEGLEAGERESPSPEAPPAETPTPDWETRRPERGERPAGAAFASLGEEIRSAVNEALRGMRPGRAARESIREAARSLREELGTFSRDVSAGVVVRDLFGLAPAVEEAELSLPTEAGDRLTVRNPRGDVRLVRSADARVRAHVRKQVWGKVKHHGMMEDLLGHIRVTLERRGDGLLLEAAGPTDHWPKFRFRVDMTVEVPEGIPVAVDVRSGDVDAADLSADLQVEVGSGDLKTGTHRGAVAGRVRSGSVKIAEADGCTLHVQSGDVRIGEVRGDATLNASSGDLRVERVAGALALGVASGDVEIGEVGGAARVQVASGDVRIARCAGDIDATVQSGDVELRADDPRQVKVRVTSGDLQVHLNALAGGGHVELDVIHGDLTLTVDPSVRAAVSAESRAGDLDVRLPLQDIRKTRTHLEGILGSAESRIALRVLSGDLTVREG